MKRTEMKRTEMKRRPWPKPYSGSEGDADPEVAHAEYSAGSEYSDGPEDAAEPGDVAAEPAPETPAGDAGSVPGQAWLDAQRGFEPEAERGQAWLDAQRGFRPEPETLSGQARLDAERGYRAELEPGPDADGPSASHRDHPGTDAQPGPPAAPARNQAWLDAQRGYQPEAEPGRGQAQLDAQRGFRTRNGRRSRPEPRYGRNDPERPIGYDPERWAGLEADDDLPGDSEAPEPSDRADGRGAGRRAGPAFGRRSGLGSAGSSAEGSTGSLAEGPARRSKRPKKPRPQLTSEERAERTAKRQERVAKEVAADPTAAAKSVVLRQLTMGPRTRAQLRAAMARKDIPDDVANAVLDRFEQVDLIDDTEFSRQWVQSRHLGRGLAPRALAYELRQRGVADETVKNAVDEVTPEDELIAARELVRRKAAGMPNDDPQRRIRRLAGMLARKGYGGGIAMQAIREELADLAEAAEESGLGFDDDPTLG